MKLIRCAFQNVLVWVQYFLNGKLCITQILVDKYSTNGGVDQREVRFFQEPVNPALSYHFVGDPSDLYERMTENELIENLPKILNKLFSGMVISDDEKSLVFLEPCTHREPVRMKNSVFFSIVGVGNSDYWVPGYLFEDPTVYKPDLFCEPLKQIGSNSQQLELEFA